MDDVRYEYVTCAHCGKQYQLIDFNGNPHAWLCPGGYPKASCLDRLREQYPDVRFLSPDGSYK